MTSPRAASPRAAVQAMAAASPAAAVVGASTCGEPLPQGPTPVRDRDVDSPRLTRTALAATSNGVSTKAQAGTRAARLPAITPEPEAVLLRKVRALAKIHGYRCYHTHRSEHSEPGFPDVVLCRPGRPLILAELKSARGRLSEAQRAWLTDLDACEGVQTFVWRSGDTAAISAVLR